MIRNVIGKPLMLALVWLGAPQWAVPGEDLTLCPAAAPTPALKHQFVPELEAQTPGNAALLYLRAFSPEWFSHRREPGFSENLDKWKTTPLRAMPRKQLQWVLTYGPLGELDRAARREKCDWQLTDRVREDGIMMLLPELQGFRELAKLLALRARLEMADGRFDKAVYTLQTGFTMGLHLGEIPLLIANLVGFAVAHEMLEQLETLIQQPGAPNLYWALTELPRPYIELRRALQGDQLGILNQLPAIRDLEARPLGRQQLEDYALKALGQLRMGEVPSIPAPGWQEQVYLTALTAKFYPQAKKYLIEQGYKQERVEALPALQVVLLYSMMQYWRLRDDLFKWTTVPYWQGREGVRQAQEQFHKAREQLEEGLPFASVFLPAVAKVHFATVRLDRRIAALRCIEAIRLYAAGHNNKLPERLSDITDVPVPTDPVTGTAFLYEVKEGHAVLEGPAPPGETPQKNVNALHYDITLQP